MRLIDFLICDDVRQEVGNKFTLVGIYDSDIRIQVRTADAIRFPLPVNLAVFLRAQLEPGELGFDFFEMREEQIGRHRFLEMLLNHRRQFRQFPFLDCDGQANKLGVGPGQRSGRTGALSELEPRFRRL